MRSFRKFVVFWVPVFVWAGLIYYLSSYEAGDIKTTIPDYIVHFVEYGVLATLIYRGMINTSWGITQRSAFAAVGVSALYGILDEYHQTFVVGRTATIRDVVFDTIGAVFAVIVLWKLLPLMPKKLKNLAKPLHLL